MNASSFLSFLHDVEKLKDELRHSWTSSGRQESVAEHSFRLLTMALALEKEIDADMQKVMKLLIVHDFGEIFAGDHPAFKEMPEDKYEQEKKAVEKVVAPLDDEVKKEMLSLWEEYEAAETKEAKVAKALDKFEALIQHSEAGPSTWDEKEFQFNFVYGKEFDDTDPFFQELRKVLHSIFLEQSRSVYPEFEVKEE